MIHLNGISINPVDHTISHAGKTAYFSGRVRRRRKHRSILFDVACRLIIGPPATSEEIFDALYGKDSEGGPDYGIKIADIHMQHLKPKLEHIGLKLHKGHAGRSRCYRETWIAP